MSKVSCQCDKCKRDIFVGEVMVSLTMAKDKIIDESCVQPVFANVIDMWCQPCVSDVAIKHAKKLRRYLINRVDGQGAQLQPMYVTVKSLMDVEATRKLVRDIS